MTGQRQRPSRPPRGLILLVLAVASSSAASSAAAAASASAASTAITLVDSSGALTKALLPSGGGGIVALLSSPGTPTPLFFPPSSTSSSSNAMMINTVNVDEDGSVIRAPGASLEDSGSALARGMGAAAAASIASAVVMTGVTMADVEAGLDGTRHGRTLAELFAARVVMSTMTGSTRSEEADGGGGRRPSSH